MSYLLIGLGNPGEKYRGTRHNAGKMLAGWMRDEGRGKREEGEWEIMETDCFMNESGSWLKSQLKKMVSDGLHGKDGNNPNNPSPLNHLVIIHDDLDIPLGKFKIQFGKGPRLHNGVLSVEQALGTKEFWRIRIGIDNRLTGQQADRLTGQQVNRLKNTDSGEDYVLERFTAAEKKILESVFPDIRDRLLKKVQPFMAKNVVI